MRYILAYHLLIRPPTGEISQFLGGDARRSARQKLQMLFRRPLVSGVRTFVACVIE